MKRVSTIVFALLCAATRLAAQECERRFLPTTLNGADYEWLRSARVLGYAEGDLEIVRRLSSWRARRGYCVRGPGSIRGDTIPHVGRFRFDWAPLTLRSAYNSAYPHDENNGALWAGRGLSGALSGGVHMRAGPLSVGIEPVFAASQNKNFRLAPSRLPNTYAFPLFGSIIDWPQRFGDASVATVDPGQSYARIDMGMLALGISTENVWWGPLRAVPLMMSNTGPGLPHVFLGTRTVNIWIGRIAGELTWGRLEESGFFDNDQANNYRLFAGIALGLTPRGLDGFTLGFTRVYHAADFDSLTFRNKLLVPYQDTRVNLKENQLISFFLHWVLPSSGFEFSAEWARDDHWADQHDLIKEPDHAQAYALGIQKLIDRQENWWRIYGELIHLEGATPYRGGRAVFGFYTHTTVTQGHTHEGSLLGAWTGPGSDAELIGLDRVSVGGFFGGFLSRVRFNTDAYYKVLAPASGGRHHDVEMTAGARAAWHWRGLEYDLRTSLSRRSNRAPNPPSLIEWNLGADLTVRIPNFGRFNP